MARHRLLGGIWKIEKHETNMNDDFPGDHLDVVVLHITSHTFALN